MGFVILSILLGLCFLRDDCGLLFLLWMSMLSIVR